MDEFERMKKHLFWQAVAIGIIIGLSIAGLISIIADKLK